MEVTNARVDGISVNYAYTLAHTAAHLVLPTPLQLGTQANAHLAFTGALPRHSNNSFTLLGLSENVLSLSNFYPMLAPHRGQAWALDIPDPQGDIGFFESALYRVEVTVPTQQVIVATGTTVGAQSAGEGWVTYHIVQGPAREFALLLSPRYQVEEADAYGTHVRSFFYPEDADAGHSALWQAVAALEIYSDQFGPYPYREMAVVEAPINYRGQEFPGLNLIGSQTYNKYVKDLESRVVHEVGHQWWYNQVGSDQINAPWQDEGLTEFTMYYYYALRYGPPVGDALRHSRWAAPVKLAADGGRDMPIGRTVADYKKNNYETMIYAKGALFFATLRDELGPDVFIRLLRSYAERDRWRIAQPGELKALAEEVSGRDLTALFSKWLDGAQ
jgi:aminopeptidase N